MSQPRDPKVDELVNSYFERREQGAEIPLTELCKECPHLLPEVEAQIARRERVRRLLGAAEQPQREEPGGVPGRYEGLVLHAEGRMGRVYRADDIETGREVAYKVLHAHHSGNYFEGRFEREARLTARLTYPGIVPVYGLVVDERSGLPAYAMQFIEGETLDAVIRAADWQAAGRPREALTRLLGHLIDVGRAVAYAHTQKVIHNDLKSDNVCVARNDVTGAAETFVIDWSEAREFDRDLTPDDTAKDVVRLGVVLHEILTGEPPAVKTRAPGSPPVDERRPGPGLKHRAVPKPLAAVCSTAMAAGYPTVTALTDDLRAWIERRAVSVYRDYLHVRAIRWASRHPAAATSLVAATALFVVGWVAWTQTQQAAFNRRWMLHNEGMVYVLNAGNQSVNPAVRTDPVARQNTIAECRKAVRAFELLTAEFPGNPAHQYYLGLSCELLAGFLVFPGSPDLAETLTLCDRAEGLLAPFMDGRRGTEDLIAVRNTPLGSTSQLGIVSDHRVIFFTRCYALILLNRPSEALVAYDRTNPPMAEAHNRMATRFVRPDFSLVAGLLTLQTPPQYETDPAKFGAFRTVLIRAAEQEQSGMPWSHGPAADHVKAMRLAGHLAEIPSVNPAAVYNAACAFALASAEPGIDAVEKERRAARAVAYLDRIRKGGYFEFQVATYGVLNAKSYQEAFKRRRELVTDKDLNPLRGRADFEAVRAAVPPPPAK